MLFFLTPVFVPPNKQFPGAFHGQESMLAVRPFVANFNVMDCLRDGDADVFVFRSLRKGHVDRENVTSYAPRDRPKDGRILHKYLVEIHIVDWRNPTMCWWNFTL